MWGTAASSTQCEGAAEASDWWAWERAGNAPLSGTGNDFATRYREDFGLLSSLGLRHHRLSIEWARIEPEPGEFSRAALDHYRRIVEGSRARDLVPVATLHHFTLPVWMAERGGFESDAVVDRLAGYAARVGDALGDGLGLACTLNEPNIVAVMGYLLGVFPPKVRDRARFEDVSARMRRAHRAMVDALRAGPGRFPVGLTLSMAELEAAPGGEAQCARALEHLEDAYLRELHGDDFLGVQTYTRLRFGPDGPLPPEPGVRTTKMGYEYRPEALEHAVRRAAAVAGIPVVVTEFGISTDDDAERCEYLDASFEGVAACLSDGLDVRGIFHWTLMDNFEWVSGYAQRFGIVECDRQTFERRPKPSAAHLGALCSSWRSPFGAPQGR